MRPVCCWTHQTFGLHYKGGRLESIDAVDFGPVCMRGVNLSPKARYVSRGQFLGERMFRNVLKP